MSGLRFVIRLSVWILVAGASTAAPAVGAVEAQFFGLHVHRPAVDSLRGAMSTWPSVPFGSLRLWDTKVAWADLEPRPGVWGFERLDRIVEYATRKGVDLLLPLGLTPSWTASRPLEPSAYQPGWASPPRDPADWRRYVDTVALRYGDRILNYEIWNEPNLERFFSGTVDDYIALTRAASEVLRSRIPNCRVVGPSIVGPSGLRFLDEFLAKGGGKLVDVISVHGYVSEGRGPEAARAFYQDVRDILAKHGRANLPIWNTECGFQVVNSQPIPADGRSAPRAGRRIISQAEASEFLVRTFAIAAAEGIERVYWYAWDNLRFGLVEPDGVTEKPGCDGFRFAARWLGGATKIQLRSGQGGLHDLTFFRATGTRARMLWTTGRTQTVSLVAPWNRLAAYRSDGRFVGPGAGAGPRRVEVRGAPLVLGSSIRSTGPVGAK